MSPNMLSELSWAPWKSINCCLYIRIYKHCGYASASCWGGIGGGVELVSFGTYKSLNHRQVTLSILVFPLFPSLIIYYLFF
jgi:hypothetical protein